MPAKVENLYYPELTMYQTIEKSRDLGPEDTAFEFFGRKISYDKLIKDINIAARAFVRSGIRKGDRVTICMPNVPQAMVCFYALNRIGAVSNMVHPQSARDEITFYLNVSRSKMILTLDMFYEKVAEALEGVDHMVTILVARIQDELPPHLAVAYEIKVGHKLRKFPDGPHALLWKDYVKNGKLKKGEAEILPPHDFDKNRTSVILYSGGTTGVPKGICLSDFNFNALAEQGKHAIGVEIRRGMSMLSCMPCFHGFGLGINLHLILVYGGKCILMPNFTPKSYAKTLVTRKPNFIAGVPTIFEALLHLPELEKANMDYLYGAFCGGDSLSVELKKKVDDFLKAHGASIQVREGYGLTECVTASCLTPKDTYKPGSIGLGFPDMLYAIVKPGTDEVLPPGEEGEIILTGPTLMLGYLDNPEETAKTLRVLADGRTWLYTGDLGYMDEEDYIYFRQRMKRMIVTNGYNIYPAQIENAIDSCDEVSYCCVIGVKDPRRMQRVRAYVVLRDGISPSEEVKARILEQIGKKIAKYAMPREIFFRDELPKTLVGKVAYRKLEEEAEAEKADVKDN